MSVNAVHPGALATGLWNQNSGALAAFVRVFSWFMRSPEVGGNAVLNVLDAARQRVATGRYFRITKESEPQPQAADTALARMLWESSIAWGNLA